MARIEYEQSLVETVVFLATREDEQQECEFHLAIDPLYAIADEELRQREFVPVFRDFFSRLGLDKTIVDLIAERPLVGEQVDRLLVREASRKRDESVEMFVRDSKDETAAICTLVIQACPDSLVHSGRFVPRIRRELLHVADMLDERFGYDRESLAGVSSHQNLVRDRYRVLWDVYVEGRLEREGRGIDGEVKHLQQAIGRVFAQDDACLDGAVFRRAFEAPRLTHQMLMDYASNPHQLINSSIQV